MMKNKKAKKHFERATKAVLLYRVSTREQREGYSIDAQRNRLLNSYCPEHGLEVKEEFTIIESSTKDERKEFNKMIDYIKKQKEPIALVCDKVDRLQRSFRELPVIDELRRSGKLEVHFYVERCVLTARSQSHELMQYHFYIMQAEQYANAISDNVKRAFLQLRNEGRHIGIAPLGYINIKKGRERADLQVDTLRAPLIRQLFEKYSTGMYSYRQIRDYSIEIGLTNRRSGKPLTISQIESMLQNPFYIGKSYNPENDTWVEHPYHIFIPYELFEKCQKSKNKRAHKHSNKTKQDFIFSGLITCKNCGCRITPEIKKGKYVYLRPFPKKLKNGCKCNCRAINEEIALKLVTEVINKISFSEDLLSAVLKGVKSRIDVIQGYKENSLKNLQEAEKLLARKKQRLIDLYTNTSALSLEDFQEESSKISKEQLILSNKIKAQIQNPNTIDVTLEYLVSLSLKLPVIFKSSRNVQKRELLSLVFSNFYLDGQKLLYTLRSPFDLLSKRASCSIILGRKDSNL